MPSRLTTAHPPSDLHLELAARIAEQIRNSHLGAGRLLRETALSRSLGVSRTPVRAALRHLAAAGVVEARPKGGYVVLRSEGVMGTAVVHNESGPYARMLRDIVLNEIPRPTSESWLMRRYDADRGEIVRALRRLVREGLADPLPGRGWNVIDFCSEQLARSYQLRMVLEPAILCAEHYTVQREALGSLKSEHLDALAGLGRRSSAELFELDARFHETLAAGSSNPMLTDPIRRQNCLRRLSEYLGYSRKDRTRSSMREHVAIIDALLAGKRREAAELLHRHLATSMTQTLEHMPADLSSIRTGRIRLAEKEAVSVVRRPGEVLQGTPPLACSRPRDRSMRPRTNSQSGPARRA